MVSFAPASRGLNEWSLRDSRGGSPEAVRRGCGVKGAGRGVERLPGRSPIREAKWMDVRLLLLRPERADDPIIVERAGGLRVTRTEECAVGRVSSRDQRSGSPGLLFLPKEAARVARAREPASCPRRLVAAQADPYRSGSGSTARRCISSRAGAGVECARKGGSRKQRTRHRSRCSATRLAKSRQTLSVRRLPEKATPCACRRPTPRAEPGLAPPALSPRRPRRAPPPPQLRGRPERAGLPWRCVPNPHR